jgi:voltage-gated potassium channel
MDSELTGLRRVKRRTYEILEVASPEDRASRAIQGCILLLIVLTLIALMVETMEPVYWRWRETLLAFEAFSVAVFTIEYGLRIWSCTESESFRGPILGRIRFALTPLALIDFVAIAPFYLPFVGVDLVFMRAFRLVRLMRVLKLGRYSNALRSIGGVVRAKKEELATVVFFMLILLVVASSLMYEVEHTTQPEKFSSIPATMWWGVMTLTTVGYGDVYPVTPLGQFLASVVAVLGIGLFALPTGVIGSGFLEQIQKRGPGPKLCPHCGRSLEG